MGRLAQLGRDCLQFVINLIALGLTTASIGGLLDRPVINSLYNVRYEITMKLNGTYRPTSIAPSIVRVGTSDVTSRIHCFKTARYKGRYEKDNN